MQYFKNCSTMEDLKKEYRRLALKNHPDMGGSVEAMAEINAAYEAACHRMQDEPTEKASTFIDMIDALIRMGVDVEICGSWVWLSGNTYAHKDAIKAMGFRWSAAKKRWYWAANLGKKRRGTASMNQIRKNYGSRVYKASAQAIAMA